MQQREGNPIIQKNNGRDFQHSLSTRKSEHVKKIKWKWKDLEQFNVMFVEKRNTWGLLNPKNPTFSNTSYKKVKQKYSKVTYSPSQGRL